MISMYINIINQISCVMFFDREYLEEIICVIFREEFSYIFFFMGVEGFVLLLIFEIFFKMVGDNSERRILVFFIYFELIHLLLASILLGGALIDISARGMFMTTALLIIGASGAETAVFLALFIRFFKLTGSITFLDIRKLKMKK